MAIDREETLRKAEKLLKQGRLELAIAEYARIVDAYPHDLTTANALGDLYHRTGQTEKAAGEYLRLADHFLAEGFIAKAAALYKKVLKIQPDEERAQLQLAAASIRQGLLANAKSYLTAVAARRRQRGDQAGANEIVLRIGDLDPADVAARLTAARVLADSGNHAASAARLTEAAADLAQRGREPEAVDLLKEAVRLRPDDGRLRAQLVRASLAAGDAVTANGALNDAAAEEDPGLRPMFIERELRAGRPATARAAIDRMLAREPARLVEVVEIATALAPTDAQAAFACIESAADALTAREQWGRAAEVLEAFVDRRRDHIPALLKLVEVCVDGGLESVMYAAQGRLADAYLAGGHGDEARVIAEDLIAREPWEDAHVHRLRDALVLLRDPDPEATIAARVGAHVTLEDSAGEHDFDTGPDDPEGVYNLDQADAVAAGGSPGATDSSDGAAAVMEIDLTESLSALAPQEWPPNAGSAKAVEDPMAAPDDGRSLDDVFGEFRAEVSRETSADAAAEQYRLAITYRDMGMVDRAIEALEQAARAPRQRFEAAGLLARLHRERGQLPQAIEWFERAAEAPAPTVEDGRALLYELGDTLETAGESMRAFAVFLELQADAGAYRDVNERVERLSRVQTGG